MKKRNRRSIWLLVYVVLTACGGFQQVDPDAQATQIAANIFATQTAEAPAPTSTPLPTATFTPTPPPSPTPTPTPTTGQSENEGGQTVDTIRLPTATPTPQPTPTTETAPSAIAVEKANLRAGPGTNYPVIDSSEAGDAFEIIGRDAAAEWWQVVTATGNTAWINAELVEVSGVEEVQEVAAPPPPPPTTPPTSGQEGVLVSDTATDFADPTKGWTYHWSQGRNNFEWQDMAKMPNDCFHSPNEMTLEICRDTLTVEIRSRGDAALQWQAPHSGSYRFEWYADEVNGQSSIWFYNHLTRIRNLEPGAELPYSATVENIDQYHQFFFLPQFDTSYRIKVYRLQE